MTTTLTTTKKTQLLLKPKPFMSQLSTLDLQYLSIVFVTLSSIRNSIRDVIE